MYNKGLSKVFGIACLIIMLSIVSIPIFSVSVFGQATVGVGVDDYYDYRFAVTSNRTITGSDLSSLSWIVEGANAVKVKIVIANIVNQEIKYQMLFLYENGSEVDDTFTINIRDGSGNFSYGSGIPFVVSSGISDGDDVFPDKAGVDIYINYSQTEDFPSVQRSINWMAWSDTTTFLSSHREAGFDSNTGILVHYIETIVSTNEQPISIRITFDLIDSNAIIIPEFPSLVVIPLVLTIALFSIFIRKQLHKTKTS
ncbi:MAG: hypothetical protein P8X91_08120 [Candidatus Bathyarchaeota archaeon]